MSSRAVLAALIGRSRRDDATTPTHFFLSRSLFFGCNYDAATRLKVENEVSKGLHHLACTALVEVFGLCGS